MDRRAGADPADADSEVNGPRKGSQLKARVYGVERCFSRHLPSSRFCTSLTVSAIFFVRLFTILLLTGELNWAVTLIGGRGEPGGEVVSSLERFYSPE